MRLLLLAGTDAARQLASVLAAMPDVRVIATVARPDRPPRPLGVPVRIGPFGGEEAFRGFLQAEGIEAILDATHPFATRISHRAAAIAAEAGMPYAQLLRPPWQPGPEDDWRFAHDMADVPRHVPEHGAVLVESRQGIETLAVLSQRPIYARGAADAAAFPFARGGYLGEPAPRSLGDEVTLLHRLGIGSLVAENTGGAQGRAALEAARQLRLPVVMIRRPLQPEAVRLTSVAAAISWVRRLV